MIGEPQTYGLAAANHRPLYTRTGVTIIIPISDYDYAEEATMARSSNQKTDLKPMNGMAMEKNRRPPTIVISAADMNIGTSVSASSWLPIHSWRWRVHRRTG